MSNSPKYLEQYERVLRWYERFKEINTGLPHYKSSDYYQDEVYAFFMNCYHLKDWIKNDPTLTNKNINVEDFVNKNSYLKQCGDICNSIKHLRLDNKRSNKKHVLGPRKFKLNLSNLVISVKYMIGKQNAFDVATKCVEAWKNFINQI